MSDGWDQHKAQNQDLAVAIGQIMATTNANREWLTSLDAIVQGQGRQISAALVRIEHVDQVMNELDRLVRSGNGTSLAVRVELAVEEQVRVRASLETLHRLHDSATQQQQQLLNTHANWTSNGKVVQLLVVGLFQLATLAVAVYAVIK